MQPSHPQAPTPKSSVFLWACIFGFCIAVGLGIYTIIKHISTGYSVIAFLLAALAIPFAAMQAIPGLWKRVKQSGKIGLRVFAVIFVVSSIVMNVYLLARPHAAASPPIPTLQQEPVLSPVGSTTFDQVSFENPVDVGNLIIVAVTQFRTSVKGVPTDTFHNRYIPALDPTKPLYANRDASTDYVELYYAVTVKAGYDTITVQFTPIKESDEEDSNVGIFAFSGLNSSAPFDQKAFNYGNSDTPNAGDLVAKQAHELIFVVGVDCGLDNPSDPRVNTDAAPGRGYTLPEQQPNSATYERFYAEYRLVTPGVYSPNFTLQYAVCWAAAGALFKQ